ncbi:MAG: dipeptidase [Acidobacteriota bacterium]
MSAPQAKSSQDVFDRIEREHEAYLDELKDYLRIPSISTDPAYDADVRRCAEFLLEKMRQAGLDARLIETEGKPLVYGERNDVPGAPTLLFYGHYDVQPADPLDLWNTPPFEPTVRDGKLFARGATDDKGQSFAQLKAVAALMAERGSLPINVRFLVEGEEESGGESIDAYVRSHADELSCDGVFVSDSSMYSAGQPAIVYGLKGLTYMELRVTGPDHDLHSGVHGGAVRNPANALTQILDALIDAGTGRIQIPGFYDAVLPLEEWERKEFAALPFSEDAYRRETGVPETHGEEGYTTLERRGARPTLDINGIWGGYQGEGAKTVIPSIAGAKVSMRLVPDQDPDEIARLFEQHVQAIKPPGVTVEVLAHHGAQPVLITTEGAVFESAMAAAEDVWQRPVRVREGGSIPIVGTFAEALGVPIVLLGFGLDDDNLHAPNEKFDVANFYDGIRAVVRLIDRLGANA